jgi:phosphopantetheinyl transferase (holo-ACP synthase)
MSCSPQLPQWVSYMQALAVPIIGLIVALLGVWISARQMLTAKEKLQLDEFDRQYERRFAVYEATRKMLEAVFKMKLTEADIQVYGSHMLDAQFLFNDDLYKYLRELHQHINILADTRLTLK